MKIRIMRHGALEIRAETTVEMFALDSWYDRWQEGTATLHVEGYEHDLTSEYSIDTKMKQVSLPENQEHFHNHTGESMVVSGYLPNMPAKDRQGRLAQPEAFCQSNRQWQQNLSLFQGCILPIQPQFDQPE